MQFYISKKLLKEQSLCAFNSSQLKKTRSLNFSTSVLRLEEELTPRSRHFPWTGIQWKVVLAMSVVITLVHSTGCPLLWHSCFFVWSLFCASMLSQIPQCGLGVSAGPRWLAVARLDVSVPFRRVGEFCHLGASCVVLVTPGTREQTLSHFI